MSNIFRIGSRYVYDRQWIKTEEVNVTTLDDLINVFGIPKFCKIDVEGFEEEVIKGLSTPIPYISFEFLKELLDVTKKCCDLLSLIGNALYNYTVDNKFILKEWVKKQDLINQLLINDEKKLNGDVYVILN